MFLTDIFGPALVVGQGRGAGWVDCEDADAFHAALFSADARCKARGVPGLLLVTAGFDPARMGRANDALVERLEARAWDLLYLAHDRPDDLDDAGAGAPMTRRAWYRCETLPRRVWALGVGRSLLQRWTLMKSRPRPVHSPARWLGHWARDAAAALSQPDATLVACPAFAQTRATPAWRSAA